MHLLHEVRDGVFRTAFGKDLAKISGAVLAYLAYPCVVPMKLRAAKGGNPMIEKCIGEHEGQSNNKKRTEPVQQMRHTVGLHRILAPTDLSRDGRKAVEYAVALAEHFNAQLTLLHVYLAPSFSDYPHQVIDYRFAEEARAALDSFWSKIKQECPQTDTELRCGVAEEQIVAAAKDLDVDLIVTSAHKHNWFNRLMDGNEFEYVSQHAPCPVLVVRTGTKDFIKAFNRYPSFCGRYHVPTSEL